MRLKMERALKWLLPALIVTEVALVWSRLLSIGDAVAVVAGIEVLLILLGGRQVFVAARGYRQRRASGLDAWSALEDGLSAVLPRLFARIMVLEPRLWACLFRWILRRTKLREGEFGYHKQSTMDMIVLMVVLVSPIEIVVFELLIPWAWLRWLVLFLEVYTVFWFLGFHASLSALPHRLEETGARLRHGAFAEVFVPYAEIESVGRTIQKAPKWGDGLQPAPEEEGAAYLAINGKTNLTLRLKTPLTVKGVFRSFGPVGTIYLSADEPSLFARKLEQRMGEIGDDAPTETSKKVRPAG